MRDLGRSFEVPVEPTPESRRSVEHGRLRGSVYVLLNILARADGEKRFSMTRPSVVPPSMLRNEAAVGL